jgi:hypothetical protein
MNFWFGVILVTWLVFVVAITSIFRFSIYRRKEHPPVEFRLLREPGEGLRMKIAKFDEDLPLQLLLSGAIPLTTLWLVLAGLVALNVKNPWIFLGTLAFALGGAVVISGRLLLRKMTERRHCQLGYFGEREVGEQLAPLVRRGFYVFHDVPAEAGDRKFNIDHVVIGPTGAFVIETKTRRKRKTGVKDGRKAHEVIFDGGKLLWPTGDDRGALAQADRNAKWVAEWLMKMLGREISVLPMLALPGWWVTLKGKGPVSVQNPKNLPGVIEGFRETPLTDAEVDLIRRQLDALCRDVRM